MTGRIEDPTTDTVRSGSWFGLGWRRLVVICGLISTLMIGSLAVYLTDVEGGFLALGFGIFTWLFASGRSRTGVAGLLLLSALTYGFTATAALVNLREWPGIEGVLIPGGLSGVAALGLIASICWLVRGDRAATFGPWVVVGVMAFTFIQPLWTGFRRTAEPLSADVSLIADNLDFSQAHLVVPEGPVTLALENRDLFWHTFTIEELDVDLRVPVRGEIATSFEAPPGEYRFFCAMPGHARAGMVGTLVVEDR